MWVLPNLSQSLFLALQFDHHRRRIWFHATSWMLEVVGWVYWFLTECGFFLFAFFRRWFFLHCGFCRRGGQMRTRATPPRPHPQARSTLQRWNPHKIDKNSSFYILGLIVRSCTGKIRTQVSLLKLFIAALYITETHIKEIRRVGKKGCWPRVVIKWKNKR